MHSPYRYLRSLFLDDFSPYEVHEQLFWGHVGQVLLVAQLPRAAELPPAARGSCLDLCHGQGLLQGDHVKGRIAVAALPVSLRHLDHAGCLHVHLLPLLAAAAASHRLLTTA